LHVGLVTQGLEGEKESGARSKKERKRGIQGTKLCRRVDGSAWHKTKGNSRGSEDKKGERWGGLDSANGRNVEKTIETLDRVVGKGQKGKGKRKRKKERGGGGQGLELVFCVCV